MVVLWAEIKREVSFCPKGTLSLPLGSTNNIWARGICNGWYRRPKPSRNRNPRLNPI